MLFYAALHRVNRRFAQRGLPVPQTHIMMDREIRKKFPHIRRAYRKPQSLSQCARYGGRRIHATKRDAAYKLHMELVRILPLAER